MGKLDTIIRRNRTEAMRFLVRNTAMAAATSAGLLGCAASHTTGTEAGVDGGAPADAGVFRDASWDATGDASRDDATPMDVGPRDAGRTDFGTLDIGAMPWTLPCDPTSLAGELIGLPLRQPAGRAAWFREDYLDPQGHALNRAGVPVDAGFRPLDADGRPVDPRLFAAGSILSDQDWVRSRSGAGLAIASAWGAVQAV